jgi:hypothetical protein
MSDKNIIEKAADIMGNITKFQKQSKLKAAYLEREEFKDSNLKEGFFCYNCIYWIDSIGGRCMIVSNDGPDVFGNESEVIAPHGCCNGYEPEYNKINDTSKKIDNSNIKTTL